MFRNVADLTDDEIVDVIARYGIVGVNWSIDESYFDSIADVLGVFDIDDTKENRNEIRERVCAMRDTDAECQRLRWCDGHDCFMLGLSHFEWAKRLANRSAEDIDRILAGKA